MLTEVVRDLGVQGAVASTEPHRPGKKGTKCRYFGKGNGKVGLVP